MGPRRGQRRRRGRMTRAEIGSVVMAAGAVLVACLWFLL